MSRCGPSCNFRTLGRCSILSEFDVYHTGEVEFVDVPLC